MDYLAAPAWRRAHGSGPPNVDLRRDYVDILGTHHLSWTQSSHGVTAFQNGLKANVTSDGRLINLTGSPVHGLRASTTIPGVGVHDAMVRRGAADAAMRRPRSTTSLAGAVPDGPWRSPRVEDGDADRGRRDRPDDRRCPNGPVLWRANMTHDDAAGSGNAWDYDPAATCRTTAVSCIRSRSPCSMARHCRATTLTSSMTRWTMTRRSRRTIRATSGLGLGLRPDVLRHDQRCAELLDDQPVHVEQGRSVQLQENANSSGCSTTPHQRVPNYLLAPPIGFTEAAGQIPGSERERPGCGRRRAARPLARRGGHGEWPPRRPPRQQTPSMTTLEDGVRHHADVPEP